MSGATNRSVRKCGRINPTAARAAISRSPWSANAMTNRVWNVKV